MLAEQNLSIRYYSEGQVMKSAAVIDPKEAVLSVVQNDLGWVTITVPGVGPGELILIEMRMNPPATDRTNSDR